MKLVENFFSDVFAKEFDDIKNLCSKFGLKKFKSKGKKNFQIININ